MEIKNNYLLLMIVSIIAIIAIVVITLMNQNANIQINELGVDLPEENILGDAKRLERFKLPPNTTQKSTETQKETTNVGDCSSLVSDID